MEDKENVTAVNTETDSTDNAQYIEAINRLKENSVDKAKYEKLKAENKALLDSVVNGQTIEMPKQEDKKSISDLRDKFFENVQKSATDIQIVKSSLELRDALIEDGQADPYLPLGPQIAPTQLDVEAANRTAEIYKDCIEYANGDNQLFINELQRRMVDVKLPTTTRK